MRANILLVLVALALIALIVWLGLKGWREWQSRRWKVDVWELDDSSSGVYLVREDDSRHVLVKKFETGDDQAMLEGIVAAKDYKKSLRQLNS